MPESSNDSSLSEPLLLEHEVWENRARFTPKAERIPFSPQEVAAALLKNPGRFRSPLTLLDKLKLKLYAASEPLDFFGFSKNFSFDSQEYFIPFQWQILLRYLAREGLIEKPQAVTSRLGHDHPKIQGLSLLESENEKKSAGFSNGIDLETMLSKTVGELLERYFLSKDSSSLRASVNELAKSKKNFLHPEKLSQFSEEQKKRSSRFAFRTDEIISWVKGKEIFTQKEVLLPSQGVFRNYALSGGEAILRDPNSNGGAGHFTREEAILGGIYENVERDAFLIYWLNSIAPTVIEAESIENEELQTLITQLKRYRFEVYFLNTTTDIGIPSFLCVLIDRSNGGPRIAVGGASGFNIHATLLNCTREASSVFNYFYLQKFPAALGENYRPFSDRKIDRETRILLWQNPAMFSRMEFFLKGKRQSLAEAFPTLPHFTSILEEYAYVLDIFRKRGKGYEIYVYEVKNRILDALGFHVVKVIIPEVIHLYLNEALAPLGAGRLKETPKKMGYPETIEWNPLPHPFP